MAKRKASRNAQIRKMLQETGTTIDGKYLLKIPELGVVTKKYIKKFTDLMLAYSIKSYEPENEGKTLEEVEGYREEFNTIMDKFRRDYTEIMSVLQESGQI